MHVKVRRSTRSSQHIRKVKEFQTLSFSVFYLCDISKNATFLTRNNFSNFTLDTLVLWFLNFLIHEGDLIAASKTSTELQFFNSWKQKTFVTHFTPQRFFTAFGYFSSFFLLFFPSCSKSWQRRWCCVHEFTSWLW